MIQLDYGNFSLLKLLAGYLILAGILILLKKYPLQQVVSKLFLDLHLIILIIPMLTLAAQEQRPLDDVFLLLLGYSVVFVTLKLFEKLKVNFPSPSKALSLSILFVLSLVYAYLFFGMLFIGGLGWFNLNFYEIYSTRELYNANALPFFGYLLSWVAYVFNIFLMVFFLHKKKYILVVFFILMQVMLFGMTNHKLILFVPVVVLFFYLMFMYKLNSKIFLMASIGIALAIILSFMHPMFEGLSMRAFYTPAAMHTLYFDYFSTHSSALMSGTRWASIFDAPYDSKAVQIVAQHFWGRDFSPNVGWLGNAYANFGFGGIVVFALMLSIYLKLADEFVSKIPGGKKFSVIMIPVIFSLCSSAFNTVLVTHGGILLLLILWLTPSLVKNN
ncbi:hypothetical protein [Thiomicrorhabdus lithotrophica]|uniref:Uncharacterized protein n=1 Tax=Thiomicrorhabdus lithotrophica TaxID=2949997 RepID=A0ABY8CCD0_9GAMM|nr:hypothetical protein [Thiomicrorhabdus lithotrophica]WEJ63147.1 hypothetical protein NR989_02535 [Thiomicrorhabdus lithotrophica]